MDNPSVHIAVRRNRRSHTQESGQDPVVRLRDGDEFELELHNPTNGRIGCKVSLNGRAISSSLLVLRPGERLFLDRHLDTAKRFRFSTYQVEGTPGNMTAVADNGAVRVEFFRESPPPPPPIAVNTFTYPPPGVPYWINPLPGQFTVGGYVDTTLTTGGDFQFGSNVTTKSFDGGVSGSGDALNYFSQSSDDATQAKSSVSAELGRIRGPRRLVRVTNDASRAPEVETGRVEQGSESSQEMRTVDVQFQTWAFHTAGLRILPEGAVDPRDVRAYCTGCGRRAKQGWRFCPVCGTAV